MRAFLEETGNTEEQTALVVTKNRCNALRNPLAAYPANLTTADVLASRPEAEPLKHGDIAAYADGAIVMVLARESTLSGLAGRPVFIDGIGWNQHTPNIEERELHRAIYAENASQMAYRMAGISDPSTQLDFAELDDTFSYKELQHLEALGLAEPRTGRTVAGAGDILPRRRPAGERLRRPPGLRLHLRYVLPAQRAGGGAAAAGHGRRASVARS